MPQPIVKSDIQKEHQSATVGSTTGGGSANVVKVYQNQFQYIVTKGTNNESNGANGALKSVATPTDYVSSSGPAEMADVSNGEVKVVIKQTEQETLEQQEQSIIAALYQQQQQNQSKNGNNRVSAHRESPASSPSPPPPSSQQGHSATGTSQKMSNGSNATAAGKMSAPATTPVGGSATAGNSAGGNASNTANFHNFIGRLISKDNMLLISEDIIEVGRNSTKSQVDFHVGKNSFVSRKHFIIQHDMNDDFNLFCLSKNGVFIDNVFHRKCAEPYKLPKV